MDFIYYGKKTFTETREWIIRNSPVPIGTVPIYQLQEKQVLAEDLTWGSFPRYFNWSRQNKAFSYFTIHAEVSLRFHTI